MQNEFSAEKVVLSVKWLCF